MPSVQTILLKHPVLLDRIFLCQSTRIGLDLIKIVGSQYNTKTYKRGKTGRDGWQRNIINMAGDRNLIKIDGDFLTSTEKVIFYKSRGRKKVLNSQRKECIPFTWQTYKDYLMKSHKLRAG